MGSVIPLHNHARALVISSTDSGFSLSMRPALNNLQRAAVTQHPSREHAKRQANRLMMAFPDVYVALIDETEAAHAR